MYATTISNDLQKSVFRLHVIANSNSKKDQNLKYVVRDNIIKYMKTICNESHSKDETIEIVSNHLDDFTQIANQTIKENGFAYTANVSLGNFEFPTKNYGDISFPSGYCFVDVTSGVVPQESKEQLQNSLNEEEYKLISNSDTSVNFKFKLVEFFNKNNIITAKNSN